MNITSMLIIFLITFGVALMIAIVILSLSAQRTRQRTKSQLLRDMLVPSDLPPYMKGPDGYRSVRNGNLGLGAWLNAEIEHEQQIHRPQGSRIKHTKSHQH